MNNTTINNTFKYAIIIGLALIPFIPLHVSNSLFFPFITGKAFDFRIIVEIVFALWLILILREKGTSVINTEKSVIPKVNLLTVAITLFTVIALVADILGYNPLRSIWSNFERMEGWIIIAHLWAYFMVMSSVLNTRENWRKFFNVVLFASFLTALYGLFQFFGWTETHQGSRVDASLGNSAYMAVFMLINAFISAFMAASYFSKKHHLVWIYSIAAAFFSFIMFQTATRGTILAWIISLLLTLTIYAVFGRKEKGQSNLSRYLAGGVIAFVALIVVLFYFNRQASFIQKNAVLGRLATISISDTTTQGRAYIWPMAIKGVFQSPKTAILGVGQENFNYIFNSNYNPKMWKQEQWFDRAHNVFLDWLVAAGLLGLISYLSLYLIALLYVVKSDISIAQKSILIGLIVAYGIHNVFVFDNQTSYVMFIMFLAYVHTLKPSKTPSIFKNFNKSQTEDSITIRDYIYVPAIVIGLACSLYFINILPIKSNQNLITALQTCSSNQAFSLNAFGKSLKPGLTMSSQEAREQLLSCASQVIPNQQISEKIRIDFYNTVKAEVDNQIKLTPKDARIYIIAGSFFNSIRDFKSATPLLEKANELSPNKQSIIYELASNYLSIGKDKEAVELMAQAYNSSIDNDIAKAGYISTLITTKQDDLANKLFGSDQAIFTDPKIVNAYMYTKQYDKAIEIYKSMIKKDPETQETYSALSYAYILNGQNTLAIATLRTAEEKFPLLKTQIDSIIKQIQEGKFKTQ